MLKVLKAPRVALDRKELKGLLVQPDLLEAMGALELRALKVQKVL